ncbi:hypothetical protein [Magnetospirillum fulvum]|uniref:Uncharacterized protein n=1 Tax=Magnetospirillum fulvum MGU-K5 TaxID=1316936 RepID=S9SC80_MAGFU|nr:hypothetical protein [Magnetospirillum fulvum]EPY03502.1 hypothetical protein K678_00285 [Magnetospirillum fulvum MGU-K5]
MTTYFHVAPEIAAKEIIAYGLKSLLQQHGGDADEAIAAHIARWSARTDRDAETFDCISLDIQSVCLFTDLDMATAWAAEEEGLVVLRIDDEDDLIEITDDAYAADDESGAVRVISSASAGDGYNMISAKFVSISRV